MKRIPETENVAVIRTDFSNPSSWQAICESLHQPSDYAIMNMDFVDDEEYSDLSVDELLLRIPESNFHSILVVVDHLAISHPEHPMLIVDLIGGTGQEFRAIPSQVPVIENNLLISNMDFGEFADAVDEDGIFRGAF